MRRPLALFGFAVFVAMWLAVRLSSAQLLVAMLVLAILFCVALFLRKRVGAVVPLLMAAALFALSVCQVYNAAVVHPLTALAGQAGRATVRVLDVEPGYGSDTVHAAVQVLELEGNPQASAFRVQLNNIPSVEIGDLVSIWLRFHRFSTTKMRTLNYGKGYYLGASALDEPVKMGVSHTVLTRVRAFQYAASSNILSSRLPLQLSSVAAAMSVGDRRFISAETSEAYRMAGLSHVLVVSGLHLSILCTYLFRLCRRLLRRRAAAVVCMVFTLCFMAFTGFTPSIVRSGFAFLLLYAGALFFRRSDTFTSMALAAVVLVVTNPYACNDVGLLLSFSATFGALGGGQLATRFENRQNSAPQTRPSLPGRFAHALVSSALTPLCVTAATLPVLIWAGMGTSLLSVPMNILAVPLVAPVVVCGLVMALPALPVLGWFATAASLVNGVLLSLLNWLTGLSAGAGWAWVPLGGLFGLAVVLEVYFLVYLAVKLSRPLSFGATALALACLAVVLSAALSAGTVQIHMAAGGANPSMVVVSGRQAVVLYRSRQSAYAITRIFRQSRVAECVLFIDMRRTPESTEYESLFSPTQLVVVQQDIVNKAVYHPFSGLELSVARQGGGTVACINISGYKVGLAAGSVSLEAYTPLDVLVSGGGTVSGQYAALLVPGAVPAWANADARLVQSDGDTQIWVRPGKSVLWKEVGDVLGDG